MGRVWGLKFGEPIFSAREGPFLEELELIFFKAGRHQN